MNACSACESGAKYARPTGPLPASTMLIGEKPGQEEAFRGWVFAGDTGKEVDGLYLPLAGLERGEVYATNCVKCRLGGNNNKPTPAQVEACARHHLPDEVERCQPELIILLGATACSLVPKIELDKEHGIPVKVKQADHNSFFGAWEGWVWPSYHPAAGLHETGMMIPLLDDFERLRKWMRGKWKAPEDRIRTDYAVVRSRSELLDDTILSESSYRFLPIDTENDGAKPWSLQYSLRPGHGRLIPINRLDLLNEFEDIASDWPGLLFHNAPFDQNVLEKMGLLELARMPFRDTMQEAYHIGNLPQGLKALAYRLLGVRMRSWQDVVMPPSRKKMIEWIMERWMEAGEHQERVEKQLKTKVKVEFKPTQMERDLKRILSHSHKEEYDLWEKVKEIGLEGYPVASIAHVEEAEAVEYGCMDADMTGRVGVELERIRGGLVEGEWKVLEEDRDQ